MPTPSGSPSIVDIVARQALALSTQLRALEDQVNSILEAVKLLQDAEAQRNAAATARVGAEEEGPRRPPVFGKHPIERASTAADTRATTTINVPELPTADRTPMASDAPPLPPIPPHLTREGTNA